MRTNRILSLVMAALCLTGCPAPNPDEEEDGGGTPIVDNCNSKEDALSKPECQLTLGVDVQDYIGTASDQDWYTFTLPATANARTLVHLTAGFGVPNTAVNLAVNVLKEDGVQSVVRKVDQHGQAAPKPIDIVFSASTPNARMFVLVSDEAANPTRPAFDVRNPYLLKVEVFDNPDVNEPNDTTPTPIALTAVNGMQQGTGTGFLATDNDVDKFSVAVPTGTNLLYMNLTGPRLTPPTPFRISYSIASSTGTVIAEGRAANEFVEINLANARKVAPGTFTISVQGYRASNVTTPIAGDTRLQYSLNVRALVDQDTNEPNDTAAAATMVSFAGVGTSQSRTGRLAYIPDSDWYRVQLPAASAPTSLRWRLSAGTAGARFPPLPGDVDRQLRVFKDVTGTNAAALCRDDASTCPKNYEGNPQHRSLVESFCQQAGAPRCLLAARQESVLKTSLQNFEGVLQIAPHAATLELLFIVEDRKNDWADDKDYTITFDWQADADEAARYAGGVEQRSVVAMSVDSSGATFPAPPAGATLLSGTLNGGFGRLYENDPNVGDGVRGPEDYEAVATDVDLYELTLPTVGAPQDRTWELQWEVDKVGGSAPGDVALDFRFCPATGACNSLTVTPSAADTLAFTGANLTSWHGQSALQPIYDRADSAGQVAVTARAYGCFCIERGSMQAGKFFLRVVGVDRSSFAPITYRVRTALTDYPKSYAGTGTEGTLSCPPPVLTDAGSGQPQYYDGGCGFLP